MFCPKCGQQNPEKGKFCRGCGTDLGNVSQALTGNLPQARPMLDRKGKLRFKQEGAAEGGEQRLRSEAEKLLAEAATAR